MDGITIGPATFARAPALCGVMICIYVCIQQNQQNTQSVKAHPFIAQLRRHSAERPIRRQAAQ